MEATTAGIRRARDTGADILITTGGASVGDHDLVKRSLEAEGVAMAFWRIAMRPGKPMMHGRLGAMRVIGLPGNPVSSYVCGFLFLVPLIRALSRPLDGPPRARDGAARTRCRRQRPARRLSARPPRAARADGALIATPVNHQDSLAAGESRCGTGTCHPRAVRAGGRRRHRLRDPAAAGLSRLTPGSRQNLIRVDLKLSGCGTHMEHIVSVHDLFRVLVSTNGSSGLSPSRRERDLGIERRYQPGDWSRCSRANNMNFCDSSTNG